MHGCRILQRATVSWLAAVLLCGGAVARGQELLTAAGKPAEGPLDAFLGEPFLEMQTVFDGGTNVREPYLGVAVDGTVLAVRPGP